MEIERTLRNCWESACGRCATKSGNMVFRQGGTHNMSSPPSLDVLQGYLRLVSDRQQMIVANMANVHTPGYHTKDIDFKSALRQGEQSGGYAQLEQAALELPGLPERPDGNNVNIDREGLMLSQTQLQFQLGVQLVKGQFSQLRTAIKEG